MSLASATTLPDASIDKVVSIQVFEYLADAQPALQEIHRVLVPGGYLVIGDMHWDTFAWHSANPARMAKMQAAYQHHLANPDVPALLPTMLRSAGFEDVKLTPLVFCDTDLRPRGLAELVMTLTQSFAVQNDLVAPEIAEDWAQEQRELAADGKFFFSLTHFVVSARRNHSA